MKTSVYQHKKSRAKYFALCFYLSALAFFLLPLKTKAQTLVTAPMGSSPAAGEYYNGSSITLTPGFSFTAASGQSLHLYISTFTCTTLGTLPGSAQNYVTTLIPRISGFKDTSQLHGLGVCQAMVSIQYLDGLGRPLQTVQVKGNPGATADVIQPMEYDSLGREIKKYLPYTSSSGNAGSYRSNALTSGAGQGAFYTSPPTGVDSTAYPFSLSKIEPSSLSRVLEQGAPGYAWQPAAARNATGRTVVSDFPLNNTTAWSADTVNSRAVAFYTATINSNGSRTLSRAGSNTAVYAAGELYVTTAKDENWTSGRGNTMETYKNMEGQTLLKRTFVYSGGAFNELSTYYVYDDKGLLAFVLPPGANPDAASAVTQTTLNNLCYQYRYDERDRMAQKKIPGKGWDFMVYNKLDQVVATQDSNQRVNNRWMVTKYDGTGRPVMTGIWTNSNTAISPAGLQSNIYGTTAQWDIRDYTSTTTGYNISTYPTVLDNILTISYYDDYNIPNLPSTYNATGSYSTLLQGQLTATKTAVLESNGTISTNMLWNVHYYDDKGRLAKTYAQHYLGGNSNYNTANYDEVANSYDFNNALTASTRAHYNTASGLALTVNESLVYDHMGRKIQSWNQINGGTNVLLSQLTYNETGQLLKKQLHSTNSGSSFLQEVNYAYNERGWLNALNNVGTPTTTQLFAMQLKYNDGTTAQYNGNIGNQVYYTYGQSQKTFTYTYDKLNRLTAGTSTDNYNESGITYDVMGNITGLQRYWNGTNIDNLSYNYTLSSNPTNQVQSITDASSDNSTNGYKTGTSTYAYDGNGNMVTDNSKGLTVTYNLSNLPAVNTLSGGTVSYTYDASGRKLRKISTLGSGSTTEYIDGIQYIGTSIDFLQTEEGRILNLGGTPNYEYSLADQLGNTRVNFDSSTGAITQRDDYLPFGMEISRGSVPSSKNEYLYNKKELQEELGQYDYGARFYDPVIGKWTSMDPLAETDRRTTPYAYGYNNPIVIVDPDGMVGDYFQEDGTYLGSDGIDDDKLYSVKNDAKITTTASGSTVTNVFSKADATDLTAKFGVTYSQFKDLAGTMYDEMSKKSTDWKEGAGIYSVLENRGSLKGKSAWEIAQSGGIYGWDHKEDILGKGADQNKAQAARKGVLAGIMNTEDYSGGAYFWQGVDFHKHYDGMHAYESFYKVGFRFNDSNDDIWHIGNHQSGKKGYDYMFESTGSAGKTTFMKYTDEYQKSNHHPKEWP